MKNIFRKFLVTLGIASLCLSLASFSTSLDGRAIVVDDGVFPQGLFAKTVGYLPGDIISVANITGDSTVDLLVIGALDPSEGVAIMLSPEAAKAVGINKDDNNIVKITKRSGQDERVYGTAIIAKQNVNDSSSVAELPNIEESDDAFEEVAKTPFEETKETEIPAEKDENLADAFDEEDFIPNDSSDADKELAYDDSEDSEDSYEEDFVPQDEEIAYEEVEEDLIPDEEIAYEEVDEEDFDAYDDSDEYEEIAAAPSDYEEDEEYEGIPLYVENEDYEEDSDIDDEVPSEYAFADDLEGYEVGEELYEEDFLPSLDEKNDELVYADDLSPLEEDEDDLLDAVIESELEDYEDSLIAENDESDEIEDVDEESYEDDFSDDDEYTAIVLVPVDNILPDSSYEDDYSDFEPSKAVAETPSVPVNPVPLDIAPAPAEKGYSKYLVSGSQDLKSGSYYIQIATYSSDSSIQNVVDSYSKNYPITIVPLSVSKQVLIGPLGMDEYAVVLERFKSYGFENSFMRLVK